MTDAEFVDELATRLNAFLAQDFERAQYVLLMPLARAGYASVGHFLGEVGLPRGITRKTPEGELADVRFLVPEIRQDMIVKFLTVTGAELQERAQKTPEKPEDPQVH